MQLKISPANRAAIANRRLTIHAYQPVARFKGQRKLALVPEPGDPWRVTLRHADMCSWVDGSLVGYTVADTLDEAIQLALQGRGVLQAMRGLGSALDDLTGALRRA